MSCLADPAKKAPSIRAFLGPIRLFLVPIQPILKVFLSRFVLLLHPKFSRLGLLAIAGENLSESKVTHESPVPIASAAFTDCLQPRPGTPRRCGGSGINRDQKSVAPRIPQPRSRTGSER